MQLLLRFLNIVCHLFNLGHVPVPLVAVNRDRAHFEEDGQVLVLEFGAALRLNSLPHDLLSCKVA